MSYNINELALITGLTTRTIRNHIKLGVLNGEKIDGNWSFTKEEIDRYLTDDYVKQAVAAKSKGIVFDFLSDPFKKANRICTILDLAVSKEEAKEVSAFFCETITKKGSDIKFSFSDEKTFYRFILSGSEDMVSEIMKEYYEQ